MALKSSSASSVPKESVKQIDKCKNQKAQAKLSVSNTGCSSVSRKKIQKRKTYSMHNRRIINTEKYRDCSDSSSDSDVDRRSMMPFTNYVKQHFSGDDVEKDLQGGGNEDICKRLNAGFSKKSKNANSINEELKKVIPKVVQLIYPISMPNVWHYLGYTNPVKEDSPASTSSIASNDESLPVLVQHSLEFRKALVSNNPMPVGVTLSNVSAKSFSVVIKWMNGKKGVVNTKNAGDILLVAKKLEMPELFIQCQSIIRFPGGEDKEYSEGEDTNDEEDEEDDEEEIYEEKETKKKPEKNSGEKSDNKTDITLIRVREKINKHQVSSVTSVESVIRDESEITPGNSSTTPDKTSRSKQKKDKSEHSTNIEKDKSKKSTRGCVVHYNMLQEKRKQFEDNARKKQCKKNQKKEDSSFSLPYENLPKKKFTCPDRINPPKKAGRMLRLTNGSTTILINKDKAVQESQRLQRLLGKDDDDDDVRPTSVNISKVCEETLRELAAWLNGDCIILTPANIRILIRKTRRYQLDVDEGCKVPLEIYPDDWMMTQLEDNRKTQLVHERSRGFDTENCDEKCAENRIENNGGNRNENSDELNCYKYKIIQGDDGVIPIKSPYMERFSQAVTDVLQVPFGLFKEQDYVKQKPDVSFDEESNGAMTCSSETSNSDSSKNSSCQSNPPEKRETNNNNCNNNILSTISRMLGWNHTTKSPNLCEMSSCKTANQKLLISTQILLNQEDIVLGESYCGGNELEQINYKTLDHTLKFPFDAYKYHWVIGTPPFCHAFCAAVVFRGKLYVSGGRNVHSHPNCVSEAVADIWRFDRNQDNWFHLGCMSFCRIHHCAVVFQDSIYFIGGLDEKLRMLSSVERLHIKNDIVKISEVSPISVARAGAAGAAHGSMLFLAGGLSNQPADGNCGFHIRDVVECYDLNADKWHKLAPLAVPRAFTTLISTSLGLYVIGGVTSINKIAPTLESVCSVADVEIYGSKSDKPRDLNMPRYAASAAVHNGHLYVFGGIELETGSYVSIVERFSTKNNNWVLANDHFSTQLKKYE
uniref:BTB domain-containing protein n=1 Tax=Strigamia maritima TaxID=126957 RepID=T1IIN6_STRMM